MKKIFFISLLLIMTVATFSQQIKPAPTLTKQDYLRKSKTQKTFAWILLGGGTAFVATGFFIAASTVGFIVINRLVTGQPGPSAPGATVLILTGGVTMLGSIPLFIASTKNKKKALSLSFKNETVPQIQRNSFVYHAIPSLSLKIRL